MANSLSARLPAPASAQDELAQIEVLQSTLAKRVEFLLEQGSSAEPVAVPASSSADKFRNDAEAAPERPDEKITTKLGMNYTSPDGYIGAFKTLFKSDSRENISNLAVGWFNFLEDEKIKVLKTLSTTIQDSTDWQKKNEIVYEYASLEDGKSFVAMMQDMGKLSKLIRSKLKDFNLKSLDKDKIPTIHIPKQPKNGELPIRVELFVPDNKGHRDIYNFTFILKPAEKIGSTVSALLR